MASSASPGEEVSVTLDVDSSSTSGLTVSLPALDGGGGKTPTRADDGEGYPANATPREHSKNVDEAESARSTDDVRRDVATPSGGTRDSTQKRVEGVSAVGSPSKDDPRVAGMGGDQDSFAGNAETAGTDSVKMTPTPPRSNQSHSTTPPHRGSRGGKLAVSAGSVLDSKVCCGGTHGAALVMPH